MVNIFKNLVVFTQKYLESMVYHFEILWKKGLTRVVTSENATSMQQKLVLEKKDISVFVDPFVYLRNGGKISFRQLIMNFNANFNK